jgi:3,4-dihydroxy 2-butanone 4-phosphate synthase/GTP cyclohydrolase II
VDLARLAGLKPAGVICEIMRDDGEMARMPDLENFGKKHGLLIVTIADLVTYRLQQETIVKRKSTGTMRPALLGPGEPFAAHLYSAEVEDTEYLALVRGDLSTATEPVLVRVQSVCPVGDPFGTRPDLAASLAAIDQAGAGVFLYVFNKARTSMAWSFSKHVTGASPPAPTPDAVPSEALRDFGLGAQVLADVGCGRIRLMSNADRKIVGLQGFGIEVVERIPVPMATARTLVSINGGGAK